jgi:hypothetical protein
MLAFSLGKGLSFVGKRLGRTGGQLAPLRHKEAPVDDRDKRLRFSPESNGGEHHKVPAASGVNIEQLETEIWQISYDPPTRKLGKT